MSLCVFLSLSLYLWRRTSRILGWLQTSHVAENDLELLLLLHILIAGLIGIGRYAQGCVHVYVCVVVCECACLVQRSTSGLPPISEATLFPKIPTFSSSVQGLQHVPVCPTLYMNFLKIKPWPQPEPGKSSCNPDSTEGKGTRLKSSK